MKFLDMLKMSSSNLWKRKVRTFLTVLGVVIGTASIVVMISLGLGLSRASMAEMEQYGGITTVMVTEQGAYGYMGMGEDEQTLGPATGSGHLDDDLINSIRSIEHVKGVYPLLETEAMLTCKGYQTYGNIKGIRYEDLDSLKLSFGQGGYFDENGAGLSVIYGNMVITDFYNEKTSDGYWWNGTVPDIDYFNDPVTYIFNMDRYYQFQWGGVDENGQPPQMPKKYLVDTAGVIEGGVEDYNSNSNNIYCDLDVLKNILKKEYKNEAIPGQPTSASGKPFKDIYYTTIMVNVDGIDNVKSVQSEINQLGYQANSNAEWVQSMQGQYRYIQLALGGIGAVSLFVAAIGIANTMMMSIYERTKEIGIMKVLGCDMKNIQGMFLMEAGYIGFIGGIVGIVLSFGISFAINTVLKKIDLGMNMAAGLSYIPAWLAFLALGFAVLVGMIAGFFPSLRAMRLSPLAAIRNE